VLQQYHAPSKTKGRETAINVVPTPEDRQTYAEILAALEATRIHQKTDRFYRGGGHWLVTPGVAYLLMQNSYGRPLGRATINLHRKRLRDGTFKFMSNGVRIAVTGETCSGRHRLQAIIEEGIPAEMAFEFGDDRVSACQNDDIKPWSAKDNIATINNELNNASLRSSATRLYLIVSNRGKRPDPQLVWTYAVQDLDNPNFSKAMNKGNRLKTAKVATPTIGTVAAYLLYERVDNPLLEQFFEELITGVRVGKLMADIRDWLIRRKGGRDQKKDARLVAAILESWKAYTNPKSRAREHSFAYLSRPVEKWNWDEFPLD
jgi:hypothetical protein